jgi:hypothetical protein
MTPAEEYAAMPIEDRLNFCERAISLMTRELTAKKTACEQARKIARADAKQHWKEGRIAAALDRDAQARADELAARSLGEVLHRFRCWQGYSDTPPDQLPFPP